MHLNLPFEELCMSYVDLCDLSARSTFHPLYAVARCVLFLFSSALSRVTD